MTPPQEAQYKARKIGSVRGLGDIYQYIAPLDEQVLAFQAVGIKHPFLADTDEIAKIRLAGVSESFLRTGIATVAAKGEKTILYRGSLLMSPAMAVLAVKDNRADRDFIIPEFYEFARDIAKREAGMRPENRTAIIYSQKGNLDITAQMDETKFLFPESGRSYYDKLVDGGVEKGSIHLIDSQTELNDVVSALSFSDPRRESFLFSESRILDNARVALGVLRTYRARAENLVYSLIKGLRSR